MAKIVITVEDSDDDGEVTVRAEFVPPAKPTDTTTPAQATALEMLMSFRPDTPYTREDG